MTLRKGRWGTMAVSKHETWETKERLELLEGWCRRGYTEEQISESMGISVVTLYLWKKRSEKIRNALKTGKDVADTQVENALYKNAIEGNITAQIFWLKNRRPDLWRDKVEAAIEGPKSISVKFEDLDKDYAE